MRASAYPVCCGSACCSVAVLLGLLLFIVFWLDRPFGRDLGVTPAPFADALTVYDAVDRGR
jgi:hypothetical protein